MNRQKIIIEISIFLVGILVLWFGVYQGIVLVFNAGKTLGSQQDSLVRWQNRQSIVQALNNTVQNLTLKDQLHLAVPVSQSTADFLKSLQGAAQNASVSIVNFTPSDNSSQINASSSTSTDSITPATMASYTVDLTVSGSYANTYTFLSNLEKIERVMQVTQVNITQTGSNVLTTDLNLTVYYLQN
jgi:ethanolamine utilization microcompartment shell protein EutS